MNFYFRFVCYVICLGAITQYGLFYGENSKPPLVGYLSCMGTEDNLLSCQRNTLGISQCKTYEIAGVKCLGKFSYKLE